MAPKFRSRVLSPPGSKTSCKIGYRWVFHMTIPMTAGSVSLALELPSRLKFQQIRKSTRFSVYSLSS